ncbi:hypothetical protein [Nostoc sp. FACHB-110]|uniref:hypothetical protein n=1 Tax=Nostoc sp. FACHB-110 TaxID=2692834 RepID=UPI0016868659|nr:hypothetical protein [Nostoc sp. FACHB-110]MBD2440763.1 hypothetical protein [Nostoc sp. FACHB-110]
MTDDSNNQDNQKILAKLAAKVMCDRQMLWKLTDKIYRMMIEDLQQQKERIKN